jgi:hypothetical protein
MKESRPETTGTRPVGGATCDKLIAAEPGKGVITVPCKKLLDN